MMKAIGLLMIADVRFWMGLSEQCQLFQVWKVVMQN
jgi:hypothetical protein